MKKLYLNLFWPVIFTGLILPFSGTAPAFKKLLKVTTRGEVSAKNTINPSSSPALLTETTESVCGELLFEPGNPDGMLYLPAFNPALGSLRSVQITTEGTLIAEISRKNLRHRDYNALFSADLNCTFPGGLQVSHTTKLTYQASMPSDRQMRTGIEALVDETTTTRKQVRESLEGFYGAGDLRIPLEAINLIDLKAEDFKYHTQLKAKVCIDYTYDAD